MRLIFYYILSIVIQEHYILYLSDALVRGPFVKPLMHRSGPGEGRRARGVYGLAGIAMGGRRGINKKKKAVKKPHYTEAAAIQYN